MTTKKRADSRNQDWCKCEVVVDSVEGLVLVGEYSIDLGADFKTNYNISIKDYDYLLILSIDWNY